MRFVKKQIRKKKTQLFIHIYIYIGKLTEYSAGT